MSTTIFMQYSNSCLVNSWIVTFSQLNICQPSFTSNATFLSLCVYSFWQFLFPLLPSHRTVSGSEDQVGGTWAQKGPSEAVTITREPRHMPRPSSPLLGKMRLPKYFYFRLTHGSWLACSYSLKGLDEFHKNCVKGHNYVRILDLGENGIEIMSCFFVVVVLYY